MNENEIKLKSILSQIQSLDKAAMDDAAQYQAMLAKPPGSLGKLEDISIKLAGITGKLKNQLNKKRIVVLCADNGVVEEGISSTPRSVTAAQAVNMTKHLTGMSSIAHHFGNEIVVADLGIYDEYTCPNILNRRISRGTKNLAVEPAMSRSQTVDAILTGIGLAYDAASDGVDILGVGEMGIGNTTTSAAVLSALTGLPVNDVTGRGSGMNDIGFTMKKELIAQALKKHMPDPNDPIDVLSKVGGLDLAAMCGVFLGSARYRIPVVIDGFISIVAALCAVRLLPASGEYMFPSHASQEIGYEAAAKELGLEPWLLLGMRLGEGSGCPLAFEVIAAACAAMNGMATFSGASIDDSYLENIRGKDCF